MEHVLKLELGTWEQVCLPFTSSVSLGQSLNFFYLSFHNFKKEGLDSKTCKNLSSFRNPVIRILINLGKLIEMHTTKFFLVIKYIIIIIFTFIA